MALLVRTISVGAWPLWTHWAPSLTGKAKNQQGAFYRSRSLDRGLHNYLSFPKRCGYHIGWQLNSHSSNNSRLRISAGPGVDWHEITAVTQQPEEKEIRRFCVFVVSPLLHAEWQHSHSNTRAQHPQHCLHRPWSRAWAGVRTPKPGLALCELGHRLPAGLLSSAGQSRC